MLSPENMRYLGHHTYGYLGPKMYGVTVYVKPPPDFWYYEKREQKNHKEFLHFLAIEERMKEEQHRKEMARQKHFRQVELPMLLKQDQMAGAKKSRQEDPADKPTPKKAKADTQA